ncbi:MAG: hypothetical protein ACK52I_28460 [Pseudomonadota bacterium]|jgi:hypothetical protein
MAKLKYKIKEKIDALPRSVKIKTLVERLEKNGISERTFYRDMQIKLDSKSSIPLDRMLVYSKLFNIDVDKLVTNPKVFVRKEIKSPLA